VRLFSSAEVKVRLRGSQERWTECVLWRQPLFGRGVHVGAEARDRKFKHRPGRFVRVKEHFSSGV